MGQYHFTPAGYLDMIRTEVPAYDRIQQAVVAATEGHPVGRALELGIGTGETTRRLLGAHPGAGVVGVDASAEMLEEARRTLDGTRVELSVGDLQDALPAGPFDLVYSALAVHHLDGAGKRDLFERVSAVLRPGGRFVMGDVVVVDEPLPSPTPLDEGFDLPDRVDDQLRWLAEVGLAGRVTWREADLAVIAADRGVAP